MADIGKQLGHQPLLRNWELNDTQDHRYNLVVAAPSDELLRKMWTVWAVFFTLFAAFSFAVWLAIVLSEKARRSPFNLYLVYLMIPDWSFTANCAITCSINATVGHYYSSAMCKWQSFYCVWGIASNAWLNGVICQEVHRLLRSSYDRKRYFPPTRKKVRLNALFVNIYCIFLALWGVVSFSWLPHRIDVYSGMTCAPLDYDRKSTIFFWCAFMPCFIIIPYGYVSYVFFDVWRRKLLPPRGRRRSLAIYFFRIVIVFLIMWGPFVVLFYLLGRKNHWVVWVSCVWAHAQAFVSACVSLMKPDIALAARQLITCQIQELRGKAGARYDSSSQWYEVEPGSSSALNFVDVPRQSVEDYQFEDETAGFSTDNRTVSLEMTRQAQSDDSRSMTKPVVTSCDNRDEDPTQSSAGTGEDDGTILHHVVHFDIPEE